MTEKRVSSLLSTTGLAILLATGCGMASHTTVPLRPAQAAPRPPAPAATTPTAPPVPPTPVVSAPWQDGTVAAAPDRSLPAPGLQVVWSHNGLPTDLGVIPGPTSGVVLEPAGALLVVETGQTDLWVAQPAANSLRRFAQVPQGTGFRWGTSGGLLWWCAGGGSTYTCHVQDPATGRTVLGTATARPIDAFASGGHVTFGGPGVRLDLPDPRQAGGAPLYAAAEAYFHRSALPALTTAYTPQVPTASIQANADSAAASLYVYLTNTAYPLNDPRAADVGMAGLWGGFGTLAAAPRNAYNAQMLTRATPAPVAVGTAAVAGDEAQVTRGPWRVVVSCSGNGAADLTEADLLAASLPAPPAWAKDPVVAVCEAGDGAHSTVYARYGSAWAQASNYHNALGAIDLFLSLQPLPPQ